LQLPVQGFDGVKQGVVVSEQLPTPVPAGLAQGQVGLHGLLVLTQPSTG
jgi:hypothetical protein